MTFPPGRMPSLESIGYYPGFPPAIPVSGAGCPRVTQPFATFHLLQAGGFSFDLHVLGAPPAFILSQDRTLHSEVLKGLEASKFKKVNGKFCPVHS